MDHLHRHLEHEIHKFLLDLYEKGLTGLGNALSTGLQKRGGLLKTGPFRRQSRPLGFQSADRRLLRRQRNTRKDAGDRSGTGGGQTARDRRTPF